jgi:hypothetical protein
MITEITNIRERYEKQKIKVVRTKKSSKKDI